MFLRFELIGVFLAPEHVGYCFYHDADVEQESPVLNIPQVSSYPAFHLGKFFGFSPIAGDLRPSGDSGFDKVAHHVFVNQLGIFLCMFQHMGSGTYNRHFSFENINELRQFVQIALSQEVAELGLAGIILGIQLAHKANAAGFVTVRMECRVLVARIEELLNLILL